MPTAGSGTGPIPTQTPRRSGLITIARSLRTALIGATRDFERQIQNRQTRRVERRTNGRSFSAAPGLPIHEQRNEP